MLTSKKTIKPYPWGTGCLGWPLLESEGLSIIQETMPPDTYESLHFHHEAQQFFYILDGVAQFDIDEQVCVVRQGEGIHIKPGQLHRISNTTDMVLEFLVISQPTTRGDRTEHNTN